MKEAIVQYGFLDPEFYRELRASYPDPPKPSTNLLDRKQRFRSTHDISHLDPEYRKLPSCWQNLLGWIGSRPFWESMVKRFPSLQNYALDRFEPSANEGYESKNTPSEDVQYYRLDIGWGGPAYGIKGGGEGNHLDYKTRVMSALLYFTDQSEMDGGEFELTDKAGDIIQRVSIRENLCVMSLQNKDGWHRVNPITRVNDWRRAVYFSLSDTRNIFNR